MAANQRVEDAVTSVSKSCDNGKWTNDSSALVVQKLCVINCVRASLSRGELSGIKTRFKRKKVSSEILVHKSAVEAKARLQDG